jgi:chorismate synthase
VSSQIGVLFRVTTFGESHGEALGVVIDGCPAGFNLDLSQIQKELGRRRPGQSKITTPRQEADEVRFLSGLFEGKTTGAPLSALVFNQDARSKDYSEWQNVFRPSHADYTYQQKYGHRDHRGGGRSSARETVARVIAGAVAKQILFSKYQITIQAFVSQVGPIILDKPYTTLDLTKTEETLVRCPDLETAAKMQDLIEEVKKQGDTIGGVLTCVVQGAPVGWGEPMFDRLQADLAKGVLSLPACKGFDYGSGFAGVSLRGSQHNDEFFNDHGKIKTKTNLSGGIQGGISNGMDIYFRAAFKPVATIMKKQNTVNSDGESAEVQGRGRHDPCVLPRAVPMVEAMAALVLLDHCLRHQAVYGGQL